MILSAVKIDQTIVREFSDAALIVVGRIKTCVESVDENRAASTKVQILNTAAFALANLARALKDAGVVGIPKCLADGAQKENGRWDDRLLQQINVNLSGLSAAVEVARAQVPGAVNGATAQGAGQAAGGQASG